MADERQKLIHLHTADVKVPSSEVLNLGEIAVQHADAEAALYIKKNNGEVSKFVDVTAIDAKVEVEKLRAEGVEEAIEGRLNTLEGSNHTHENKDVLDGISAEKVAAWDAAEGNAKADAAEKYQVKGEYEAAGAADAALEAAKADAAEKYQVKGEYEAAGAAEAVEGKLNSHKDDTVAHVTADERAEWNAAKAAIDTFLKDADMTEKAVDTLAELQTYMEADGAAAAELVNRVAVLEAIDHDAYVAADADVFASAKTYTDSLAGNYDSKGSADAALEAAKTYVDGKVDGKFDTVGSADAALEAAKADAAEKYQVKGNYEVAGAADAALEAAKTYVDGKVNGKFDTVGSADAALVDAKAYTDQEIGKIVIPSLEGYATEEWVNNKLETLSIDCGTY